MRAGIIQIRARLDRCHAAWEIKGKMVFIFAAAAILLFLGAQVLHAYTYTYHNKTAYPIRVTVSLYDDADKIGEIAPDASHQISTRFLLKNWSVDAFFENRWQHVLDLACDMLPGDHGFSVYMDEKKTPAGAVERNWRVAYE